MHEFIPVTDDMLYNNPQLFEKLIPYHVDRPCRRLQAEPLLLTPADLQSGSTCLIGGKTAHEE